MPSLILPLDPSQRYFGGYVEAMGQQYKVSMSCPAGVGTAVDPMSFRCDPELLALLEGGGLRDTLRARLTQAGDVEGFMAELADVVDKVLRTRPEQEMPPAEFYSRLVAEMDAIGWAHLVSMDELFTSVQLRDRDASGREHVFSVSIPADYPRSPPICSVDLPTSLDIRWLPGESSLATVMEHFRAALGPYLPLWDVLDDLDRHTWILEPEKPSRSTTYRRVAVAPHCSIVVQVDPKAPTAVPDTRFLGSQAVIGPLREAFSRNVLRWDHTRKIRANLEAMLEVTLPAPATTKKEDFSTDCGICYAYRLQPQEKTSPGASAKSAGRAGSEGTAKATGRSGDSGATPDRVCDNHRCRRPYHPKCLFAWLQGLPTSRVSFDTIFGQCPYCSDPISVKIAT